MAKRKTADASLTISELEQDQLLYGPYPANWPTDPIIKVVWAARGLVDAIQILKLAPDDLSVMTGVARFNRDFRDLSALLHEGYDELASTFYPNGVEIEGIDEFGGTCCAELILNFARPIWSVALMRSRDETASDVLNAIKTGEFVPLSPFRVLPNWGRVKPVFDAIPSIVIDRLERGMLSEHRHVESFSGWEILSPGDLEK